MFSENNIPKLIILTPIITALLIAFFTIYFFIKTQNNYFKEESLRLEQQYILKQKKILQKEISYILNYINYSVNNNKKLNNKELKNKLLRYIETIRFNNNGYIWVHDTNYYLKAHPFRKDMINKNDINLKDKVGSLITKKFVDKTIEKPNGIFIEYFWQKPNKINPSKKLGFFRLYKKFNWVVGTGLYMDNIENSIKQKKIELENRIDKYINTIVLISIFIIFIIGIISFFISNKINQVFMTYQNSVRKKEILLEDINNDLELKVKNAIKEATSKDRAMLHQARLARMGVMLSLIAHQWRQPLSKVSAMLMELETVTKFKKVDNSMIINTVSNSTKLLAYMSHTIDDFRNFFKPDKEKVDFFICDACLEAVSLVEASIENYGIKLIKNIKNNPKINGYEREFAQVILNLLSNAKDALNERDIKNPQINLNVSLENNIIYIQVLDNAGGIKTNDIEEVFEPYFTTKENLKGTGLGLYMSKMIVEKNMGGELLVQNTTKGAKFTIILKVNYG